jgi:uncharacterized protein (DUF4415 family)
MSKKPTSDDKLMWREARQRARQSVATMTDREDADLTAAARADADNPPLEDDAWKRMRPAVEVKFKIVARYRGQRGSQKTPTKQLVSLRIDADVLEYFKAQGPGWQSRMNAALRKAAKFKQPA